ncbi:hypothetical protein DV735_g3545, partial [Chaetothyriales sp. CBS 134920]
MDIRSPWDDVPSKGQADTNDAPADSSKSPAVAATAGNTVRTATGRKLPIRKVTVQPTSLESVDDAADPLGPLGTDSPPPPPPVSAESQAPTPPRKESKSSPPASIAEDGDAGALGSASTRGPPPVQLPPGSSARHTQPSLSLEQAAKPTFHISVGDPHKVGDLATSHIVYQVHTRTTSKAYRSPEFAVSRRYRDFLWLYTSLHNNNPGVVVPPPPEKQAVGRFETDFVESRRQALERMLNKIAAHPVLQHDADLKIFLESDSFNIDIKNKENREPDLGQAKGGGVFSAIGINVGGTSTGKFVEHDDWFHDRKIYLDALENQLKALLKALETVMAQRKSLAEAAGEFAASLGNLARVELSPDFSGPVQGLSDVQVRIKELYERQAQQDMLTLGITVDEYIRLIGSVKTAFRQRQKAFHSWHAAESELQKRRSGQEKLLKQGKSQQDKLNEVNAGVSDAEKKAHQARLLFEDMGKLMRTELDRFEREKVEDFKSGVETFLEGAVEAQKELIELWETFLLQLDVDDELNTTTDSGLIANHNQNTNQPASATTFSDVARRLIQVARRLIQGFVWFKMCGLPVAQNWPHESLMSVPGSYPVLRDKFRRRRFLIDSATAEELGAAAAAPRRRQRLRGMAPQPFSFDPKRYMAVTEIPYLDIESFTCGRMVEWLIPSMWLKKAKIVPLSFKETDKQVQRRFASSTPQIYDVVTVGGGPAGLAFLTALRSSPATAHLKTALIETQDLDKQGQWSLPPDKYSNRAISLTPASVNFLDSIGAWQHVDQARVQPYDEMQVYDAANDAAIQFDWTAETQKYNAPPRTVATMTEIANLSRGLLRRINELGAQQSLLSNTKVSSIGNGQDKADGLDLSTWPVINLAPTLPSTSSPSQITARLLVGADGFNSPVRAFANIASDGWDYGRHGVVATLKLEPREDDYSPYSDAENHATAFQRFLPASFLGGPIAILPLPNNHASLVWSTTPATAAKLKSLPLESLVHILNAALRLEQVDIQYLLSQPADTDPSWYADELSWRLQHTAQPRITSPPPTITSVQQGSVASFPLRFRHAASLTNPRIALIGDAAHTMHPLAGQGLNIGISDAQSLAKCIEYNVEHGVDIGNYMALERYSSDRFSKGLVMAGGVDLLNYAYQLGGSGNGIVSALVGRARGLGMQAFDKLGLKSLVMRVAEGS